MHYSEFRLFQHQFKSFCQKQYYQDHQFHRKKLDSILSQLITYSGQNYVVIIQDDLRCNEGREVPALSHLPNVIRVTTELLALDENIVAAVIAHEWGHHIHDHVSRPAHVCHEVNNAHELEADRYSARFLAKYGYNLEVALEYPKTNFGAIPAEKQNEILENWRSAYSQSRLSF